MKKNIKFTLMIRRLTFRVWLVCIPTLLFGAWETDHLASPLYWGIARSGSALRQLPDRIWINPSAFPEDSDLRAAAGLTMLPAEIRIAGLTASKRFGKDAITAGINHEMFGEFVRRDAEGTSDGTFTAGQTQLLAAWSRKFSSRFTAGAGLRYMSDHIDESRSSDWAGYAGFTYSLIRETTDFALAVSGIPDSPDPEFLAGFSHKLRYLPLRLTADYRFQDEHRLSNLSIGGFFTSSDALQFSAGMDFRRFDLDTGNLGADFISGMSMGARYRFRQTAVAMSVYSFGGLGTVTSLGISWYGRK